MFKVTHMCNTCVVNEYIGQTDGVDDITDVVLFAYVTCVDRCMTASIADCSREFVRCCGVQLEDMDGCPFLSKPPANRSANTTTSSGNNCCLTSQSSC